VEMGRNGGVQPPEKPLSFLGGSLTVSRMETITLATGARRWAPLLIAAALGMGADAPPDPGRKATPPPSPKFERPAKAVFADDFADGNFKGWTADEPSAWSVRGGVLRAELPDEKQLHAFLYAGDSTWTDYALDFDVCGMRGVDKGCAVRVRPGKKGLGVDLRGPGYDDLKVFMNEFQVGSGRFVNANGTWYHMRVEIRGKDKCRVAVNGKVVFEQGLRHDPPASGGIALSAYTGGLAKCTVYYDNVSVTPLAAEKPPKP
jgi:Domain of Unknown Function (DUF1080)